MNLDEVLARVEGLAPDAREALLKKALADAPKFVPSPGPQTDAWFSKADVLLYGGQPGGGKSGLLCGLALMEHERSLLMRRNGTDFEGGGGMIEDLLRLYGTRDGFSGKSPPTLRTDDGRIITFGAATNIGDEQKFQGRPRDLLGIDEATQFSESQIRFLMGWVRTTTPGQRTRTVFATNPPATSEGEWIVGMFRPWLDPTHPNPAEHGELRWFIMTPDGDVEVDGPEKVQRDGREFSPMSRTFIPSSMYDNPFIDPKEYQKQLDQLLPEQQHIATGDFMAARKDDEWQVIPTAWIEQAEARWTPEPPEHAPMCAMGVDPAQGGDDETVISCRYDGWFAPLICIPGKNTPTGNEVAGAVIAHRRNNAAVIVDMGGGYGGATKMRLNDNNIDVKGHKGASASVRRTVDNQYRFANKRSEIIWRMREALDPGQDGGSAIALPPDRQLRADLTAARFKVTSTGIQVEAKVDIVKRLGRSPDRGDAVCMAWAGGPSLMTHGNQWRQALKGSAKPNIIKGRR